MSENSGKVFKVEFRIVVPEGKDEEAAIQAVTGQVTVAAAKEGLSWGHLSVTAEDGFTQWWITQVLFPHDSTSEAIARQMWRAIQDAQDKS